MSQQDEMHFSVRLVADALFVFQEENKMGKFYKRTLATIMVVLTLLTSAPLQGFVELEWPEIDFSGVGDWFGSKASAANDLAATGQCGDDVYWEFDITTKKLVISGSGAMWDYNNVYAVVDNYSPFYKNTNIESLVVEEGVTSIGRDAFSSCSSLYTISLPDSLISLCNESFEYCQGLVDIYIPGNVTFIGSNAFNGCHKLKTVDIPDSVIEMDGSAFVNCDNLKNVTIGVGLSKLSLPAFNSCDKLISISVDANNPYFCNDEKGVIFNKDKTLLIKYPEGSTSDSYVVPKGTTSIGNSAFEYSTSLKYVFLPDSLLLIDSFAFSDCSNLLEAVIPDNVTTIKINAFYNCGKMNNLVIGSSVETIEESAFQNCIEISGKLEIPDSVTKIGVAAFRGCRKINELIIGDGLNRINDYTFEGCSAISSLSIGNSVKNIGKYAFTNCHSVGTLTIPSSVTSVDYMGFASCGLNSVTLSEGLVKIGESAFAVNQELKSIQIPASVEDIGLRVFDACLNLEEITVADNSLYYSNDENGVLFDKDKTTLVQYPIGNKKTYYSVPDTVNAIGFSAFYNATNLTDIVMADSVVSLGQGVFQSCVNLTNINLSKKLKAIPNSAFYSCVNLKRIVLHDGITEIGESAFANCSLLESIVIPKSLILINKGACAFSTEEKVANVHIYYKGTEEEWKKISVIHSNNDWGIHKNQCPFLNGQIHYSYKGYIVGELIKFGSYPQSEVKDFATISALNNKAPAWEKWTSYGYYSGDGTYGSMLQGDWMRYTDVTYNGHRYRGVKFTQYRPIYTYKTAEISNSNRSGYNTDTVYWFKYEPIYWRILDPQTGLVLSYDVIDCQPFNSSVYEVNVNAPTVYEDEYRYFKDEEHNIIANNYVLSDIREWLNKDFIDSAFNSEEKKKIETTTINNSGYYENLKDTKDKIFLLHKEDVENQKYGFDPNKWAFDKSRLGMPSDYSKIQGVETVEEGLSESILRTSSSYSKCCFCSAGIVINAATQFTHETAECSGIRPAMHLGFVASLKSQTNQSVNNKNPDQKITITPKDATGSLFDDSSSFSNFANNIFESMSNVKISSSLGESVINDSFSAKKSDIESKEVVLSRENYYNYIIPKEVIASWSTPTGTAYEFDAFMKKEKKNGNPYVSTVFGRISGSDDNYIELTSSQLKVNNKEKCDIIISAGNICSDVKYYLTQDSENSISNTTGVFSSKDLYNAFDISKTIYAYVISSGTASEPSKIGIDFVLALPEEIEHFFKNSTFSLIGENSQGIAIADNIPLLGGNTINLNAFTFPVGIDVTGSKVRVSVGFDAFSKSTGGLAGGKQKTETEWMNLKKEIKGISDNLKGSKDAFKDYQKLLKNKVKKDRTKTSKGFNIGVLGYLEFDLSNGITLVDSYVSLNGEFSFSLTQQFAAWVVPLYASLTAKAAVGVETQRAKIVDDPNLPLLFDVRLLINPSLKISGGVGVKKAVSVGVYGKGSIPFENNFITKYRNVSVAGEMGIEAELFLLSTEIPIIDGKFVIYDGYYGQSLRLLRSFEDDYINKSTSQIQTNVSVISRDYADGTSEWLGEYPISLYSLADNGVTFNVLQTSIFDQTNPQLVSFGDNVMMVWVQDDASRDTYNRMRLVYSLYDAENDSWSEPKAVYDDGHNDAYSSLATDGENVYVAWQKIDKTVTADDATSIDVFLENSEIFVAKYDATNDCFVNATKLTDNEVYDYMPSVVVNNGNAVAYYATNSDNNLMGTDNNTLHRHEIGETAEVLANNQSYIISATPEIVNGTEKLSYSIDTDGDMSTSNDITVYTISNDATTSFGKDENEVAYTFADYSMLDGTETLFVSDMNNIYYEQNGETKTVFNGSRLIEGNIGFVEQETGLSILWTENNEVGGNEFWTTSYEDGAWTEPVQISNIGGFKVSKVDVAMLGGKLVGVCNMNEMTLDEESGTYTEGEANLCSFTANDFTDISVDIYMVDESTIIPGETSSIDVYVNNVGTTDVTSIEFLLSDTLGTNTTVTKEVNIKSGATELVTLDYLVPENNAATALTVSASIPGIEESDTRDNTESIEIGKGDLSIIESEIVNFGDNYILKAVVENNSAVEAEGVVVSAIFNNPDDEPFEQNEIGPLAKEQYVDYELAFNKELVEFDENGVGKLYVKVTSSSDESADGDNMICVAVTLPQKTECAHPLKETVEAKDATCTEVGYSEYDFCLACGEKIDYIEFPNVGHSEVNHKAKAPTCTEIGWDEYVTCSICDYSTYKELPETGHSHTTVVTLPTCTTEGYTTYTCYCGDVYIADNVEPLGHSEVIHEAKVPTCTEFGWMTYVTCTRCDYTTYEELAIIEHDINYLIKIEPSCNKQGIIICECSRCDFYEESYMDATGHIDIDKDGMCDFCYSSLCDCMCHKTGIVNIIWKLLRFFYKLFGANKICVCGVEHY